MIPSSVDVRVEQTKRKKAEDAGGGGDNSGGLAYLLSGASMGVLVGEVTGIAVVDAIINTAQQRLSGEEKDEINTVATNLLNILTAPSVERDMRRQIVKLGGTPDGISLFTPVTFQSSDLGPSEYGDFTGINAIVEVETSRLGLRLIEQQYRPARFLMLNEVRIKKMSSGETLDRGRFVKRVTVGTTLTGVLTKENCCVKR